MVNPTPQSQGPRPQFVLRPVSWEAAIIVVVLTVVESSALLLGLLLGYGETERYSLASLRNPQLGPTAEGLSAINRHYQVISHLLVWIPVLIIAVFAFRSYQRRFSQQWAP